MFPRRIKAILYMPLFPIQICKICFECHLELILLVRDGDLYHWNSVWKTIWKTLMQLCDVVGIFEDNGICNEQNVSLCDCLEGFNQRIQKVGTYPSTLVGVREETFFNAQMTTFS